MQGRRGGDSRLRRRRGTQEGKYATVQTDSKNPEDTAEPVRTITWITFSEAKGDNETIHINT